jgi:xanthine dehydrogenase YagT iron-sulfur-binding subunit
MTVKGHEPIVGEKLATSLSINGNFYNVEVDSRTSLLDFLRETLGLSGTKKGCDHGQCGACTIHVNGKRTLSCLTFVAMHDGDAITTIEGLADGDELHPVQAAFLEHDGYQCGYCTPGQLMSAAAMIDEPWGPDDADVAEAMSGNICRCGAYQRIVAAIQSVRQSKAIS